MKFVTISSILFSAVWADSNHPHSGIEKQDRKSATCMTAIVPKSRSVKKVLESHDKSWLTIYSDVFL